MTPSEQQSVFTLGVESLPSLALFSPAEIQQRTDGQAHYPQLYDENLNTGELRAMNQLQQGQNTVAAAVLNMAPNVFGLANGGSQRGAVAEDENDTWQEVLQRARLSPVPKGDRT